MPELPEVETVARSLAPHLKGRRILSAEFRKPRVLRGDPEETARKLAGRLIQSVRRYGKFILLELDSGGYFIVHLGMTGKLLLNGELNSAIDKHTHAILNLDRGVLLYRDARQFGRLEWSATLPARIEKLGPDPLLIPLEDFTASLRLRKTRMKSLLLNQKFLRGMGNIYADEALFRAGIHPLAIASRLRRDRARKLYDAMREVLTEAIEKRGSSISDYVDADGRQGSFQLLHRVYRRTGQPCVACGKPIRRILVTQRGTHFCPNCQKK
ncbi:MAG: bifunctional DNA-formamidopyrimidine glycosylase/DNA-(apurinic or apyrimidinic site) lyase [Acidobacteriota bacterium]|nr:bifunctional DNA-formamidopyrimidine glycosylase/DNA-(apurinic or apyrimidinic site) lyase [Acidobacteriota bacterium]